MSLNMESESLRLVGRREPSATGVGLCESVCGED
jgi:hypothetical protein